MASLFMGSSKILLFLILFTSFQFLSVNSVQFDVGDDKGWVVPSAKHDQMYNEWASEKRFKVDDTVCFKYEKDSVMVVTDSEYEKCHAAHPIYFSNNGDTIFKLDRPGLFYFISGVTGHCERGQKMVVKVLDVENSPPPGNQNGTATGSLNHSGAVNLEAISASVVTPFIVSVLGFLFSSF